METHEFKHSLGVKAKSVITGFEGVIISRVQHITGCDTYGLKPKGLDKDGKPFDAYFFDENEIEVISQGVKKKMDKLSDGSRPPGGPGREHPKV